MSSNNICIETMDISISYKLYNLDYVVTLFALDIRKKIHNIEL
jgi:hypothetical protein